jgi:ectoine hydroxylase-related dioxygenase (phytanoyl-CoA dioxygenase family)
MTMPAGVAVTDAQRRAFWADGVVCLRAALPAATLAAMEDAVDAVLASDEVADLTDMGRALARAGEAVLVDGEPSAGRFASGVDHWRRHAQFAAFALDSDLPGLVGALLQARTVRLYEDSVLVKEPGAAERTAWHQDLGYFHVSGRQLCTTWCPLDRVTAESGAVEYVRGSHRWDRTFRPNLFVSPLEIPATEGESVPDVDALAAAGSVQLLSFDTAPGDVVVHHARTLHAAGGNRTADRRRRAISVRYCGDDARTLRRPGAPVKPHQREVADGLVLAGADYPLAWTAPR